MVLLEEGVGKDERVEEAGAVLIFATNILSRRIDPADRGVRGHPHGNSKRDCKDKLCHLKPPFDVSHTGYIGKIPYVEVIFRSPDCGPQWSHHSPLSTCRRFSLPGAT